MTIRFDGEKKWHQGWFRSLPPDSKLLYLFVYENCDVAGFCELDADEIRFATGLTPKRVRGAVEGLASTLEMNGQYAWIADYIVSQKNWPLNLDNNAHKGIIRLLTERELFSPSITKLLNGEGLPSPFEGANQGLFSPTSKSKGTSKSRKTTDYTEAFEEFWVIWKELGRAEGKPMAFENWNATIKGRDGARGHPPVSEDQLIAAAKNYRAFCVASNTERKYIMLPASFLGPKRRGWEGYLKPVKSEEDRDMAFARDIIEKEGGRNGK